MPHPRRAGPAGVAVPVLLAALGGCLAPLPGPGAVADPPEWAPAPLPPPPFDVPSAPAPFTGLFPRAWLETSRGIVVLELFPEMAPDTVASFTRLAQEGFYDGTRFHRVLAGTLVQGGDPLSRGDDASRWGWGGPGYTIPDELHPALRHAAPGVVSTAKAEPHGAGSQFFVTLVPAPRYDDREVPFGRVVRGLDVVEAISRVPTRGGVADGPPVDPPALERVTVVAPTPDPARVAREISVSAVVPAKATGDGRKATFALVVANAGTVRETVEVAARAPAEWATSVDTATLLVPAGTARVVLLDALPRGAAPGPATIAVEVRSRDDPAVRAEARVTATVGALGETVPPGAVVRARYAGLLDDGRLFDARFPEVAARTDLPRLATAWRPRLDDDVATLVLDADLVPGLARLLVGARVGETVAGRIPWPEAYARDPSGILYGKDVVFEVEVLAVR